MDLLTVKRDLLRAIQDLKADNRVQARQIATLADALAAVSARTQRIAVDLSPLAAGVTSLDVTWNSPWPDTFYGVQVTPIHGGALLGQIFHATAGKTTTTCTVVIRNTSGAPVSCGIEVLGVRGSLASP